MMELIADALHLGKAWNTQLKVNPYQEMEIVDCGDVSHVFPSC